MPKAKTRPVGNPARMTKPERLLFWQMTAAKLPPAEYGYWVAWPERRWQLDFAWPSVRACIEVQGGTMPYRDPKTGELRQGRHHTPKGYTDECERLAWLTLHGWSVLYATPAQVENGQAVEWCRQLLDALGQTIKIA